MKILCFRHSYQIHVSFPTFLISLRSRRLVRYFVHIIMGFLLYFILALGSVVHSFKPKTVLEVDRRLLLNDPQTILVQLEAIQREMQTLKTLVNTQQTTIQSLKTLVNSQQTNIHTLETLVNSQQTKIQSMQNQLNRKTDQGEMQTLKTLVNTQQSQIQTIQNQQTKMADQVVGSVYTTWGRKSCPAINGTKTVYTGITGGKPYHEVGGGVNTLCLPHDPDNAPNNFPTSLQSSTHLFGSEYQFTYGNIARDDDVPCAVCHLQSATSVLMIPAKTTCPSGWTMQYHGYLVTDNEDSGWHATDFICLHGDPEYLTEGARQHDLDGHILYPVTAVCGSLPCPPYKSGQYITCVVCSL
ncbi:uncharacterized protein LOC125662616 isoform X2 [Ostrea edulis]|uniref:uncharacterized protein LOC125662616 isoform X2 n=1 Tax=Ostrea edulis TaxID=37623 RepID=UPI0024AF83ED|nr:uncharacterized protein LOC125662616 isoform X2 [Ostrea edulis]